MVSLSNTVNNMKKEMKSVMTAGPLRAQPKAKTRSPFVWVPRTVRVVKSGAANLNLTVTTGDVVKELGSAQTAVTLNLKLLKYKVWNYTNQGASTNYVSTTPSATLLVGQTALNLQAEDFGNSSSLAAVYVNVPDTMAVLLSNQKTDSSTGLLSVTGSPPSLTTQTAVQTYLCELQVLVQA